MKNSKSVKTDKRKKKTANFTAQCRRTLVIIISYLWEDPSSHRFSSPFYPTLRLTGTEAQLTYHLVKGGGWGTPVVFLFCFCFLNRDLSRYTFNSAVTQKNDLDGYTGLQGN